jgi:alpha-glucosidase
VIDRSDKTWWQRAIFYQIYPRSFQDSNADGVGDLCGILARLDYLAGLGVDALWISPFFRSPMLDAGYDVADYRDVDPLFGSMADFGELLVAAHDRGIRVVIDLVVNHSSDQHPWFKAARSSIDDPKHDWYLWQPVTGKRPPNNWVSLFEHRSAWYPNEATGEWYLATFTRHQPEFNWRNPALRQAIYDIARFWLDAGVDGFRMDVATAYFKDSQLRSNPFSLNLNPNLFQHHLYDRNQPEVHAVFREFRALADSYGDRVLIGETHGLDAALAASCHGANGDELHMAFNFDFLFSPWGARSFRESARRWYAALPSGAWPNFTLSNHDQKRHYHRYRSGQATEARARVAAAMLLCLRGTPFLYYGEELGMDCERLPRAVLQDPLGLSTWPLAFGRDPERTPMQWDDSPHAGFSVTTPWLPVNHDYRRKNAAIQEVTPGSLLAWYKSLIILRKLEPAMQTGDITWIAAPADVLAWTRTQGRRRIDIFLGFGGRARAIRLDGGTVSLGTRAAAGSDLAPGAYWLAPYEALIVARSDI